MKRLAVGLLALVILIGCAAVYAAETGTGESLVTQGYLNDTYIPDVLQAGGDTHRGADKDRLRLCAGGSECQAQRLSGPGRWRTELCRLNHGFPL